MPKLTTWVTSDYNSGSLAPDVRCPKCKKRVLYNGNYFCEDLGYTYEGERHGGPCSWALAHPATSRADRAICRALGIDY